MINFQIRYDEAIARWQYQDREGHWSKPMRLGQLTAALQSELVSLEEAKAKPSGTPATNPATYTRSPGVAAMMEAVEYEIRAGRVVPRKISSNRHQAQVEELARLLELD
jgi:hypothetical protein